MKNKIKHVIRITFILCFLLFAIITICKPNVVSVLYEKNLSPIRMGPNKNYIAFTCNVDWGTEYIPDLLNIFEKNNIKITFFVSGRWAQNNPEILREIYNKGHEIGNHGYGHRMHSKINFDENYKEIMNTHNIVKDIVGINMVYFAPPAGDFNELTLDVANQLGYKTVLWNIDTIDWRKDSTSDKIINRVLSKPLGGSIVLMHPKLETVKALPSIIEKIEEKNILVGTISDIIN